MQRVFRVVDTRELSPKGVKTTGRFNRSVGRFGVLNPVLLAEVPDEDGVIQLQILDGNRRVRAARASRLPKIPAVVLKDTTPLDRARLTLICNSMRSNNFHTESLAITMLGDSEDAIGQAAGAIGLGPMKMQQLYRKITSMPEAVRRAMYEHRVPVTAATWIGSWPEDLQAEVLEMLARRRYLNTTTLKAMKASYDARVPVSVMPVADEREDEGADLWVEDDAVDVEFEIPMPVRNTVESSVASPIPPTAPDALPSSVVPLVAREPASVVQPSPVTMTPPASPDTAVAPSPPGMPVNAREPVSVPKREMVAIARQTGEDVRQQAGGGQPVIVQPPARPPVDPFLARLDAELLRLAQETIAHDLPRAVWIDRAMRAWNLSEQAG